MIEKFSQIPQQKKQRARVSIWWICKHHFPQMVYSNIEHFDGGNLFNFYFVYISIYKIMT
jgi:hypothetical protein